MSIPNKPRRKQITLRADATSEGVAAELISLLDSITQDGDISDEEVGALRDWLNDNKGSDLPAIDLLQTTIEQILADGVITPAERKALYSAVERVLPAELRANVRGRRIANVIVEKARLEEERAAARLAKLAEEARTAPVCEMDFMVAGVAYEGRSVTVDRFVKPGSRVFLVREPMNPHDANAIQIVVPEGYRVGYIPRDWAAIGAPLLDQGCKQIAYCKKLVAGRRYQIPVIVADLYREDVTIPGAMSMSEIPEVMTLPPPSSGCGCLSSSATALLGLAALISIFW